MMHQSTAKKTLEAMTKDLLNNSFEITKNVLSVSVGAISGVAGSFVLPSYCEKVLYRSSTPFGVGGAIGMVSTPFVMGYLFALDEHPERIVATYLISNAASLVAEGLFGKVPFSKTYTDKTEIREIE